MLVFSSGCSCGSPYVLINPGRLEQWPSLCSTSTLVVSGGGTQTVPGCDNSRIFQRCAGTGLPRSSRYIIAQCCVNLKQRGEQSFQLGPALGSNNTQTRLSGGYFSVGALLVISQQERILRVRLGLTSQSTCSFILSTKQRNCAQTVRVKRLRKEM